MEKRQVLALDRIGGRGTLNEVTKAVNAVYGEVPEPRVYELLNRLVDPGFTDREGEEYRPPSPPDTPGRKAWYWPQGEVAKAPRGKTQNALPVSIVRTDDGPTGTAGRLH